MLAQLHERLDAHFTALSARRRELRSPVFALEHELGDIDLQLLTDAVRSVVSWGLQLRYRKSWLPFVVYAAEQGYEYVGDKYWPPFEAATPGWEYDHRDWLRRQFIKFADQYTGARPKGAFADNFPIIAWPITHAVLPTYLQRYLAKLLFDFRTGLSTALLAEPDELGRRLAARTQGYTERFRIFCANTELLGQVAVALLAGEDEDSPYMVPSALDRIVESLIREQQARRWLNSARQSASNVRSSGFKSSGPHRGSSGVPKLPRPTDPRLSLRLQDGVWSAYAELPDLTVLSERLPNLYNELAHSRAEVNGVRKRLATGRLVHGGQEVRLESWPDPSKPFIQLEGGSQSANQLLADQCVLTHSRWWLFRRQGAGLAVEVRGRVLRPGRKYVVIGDESAPAPSFSWSRRAPMSVAGVAAYTLHVPDTLTHEDVARIDRLGLAALSSVAIRPVGLVASSWDGDGAVEWPVGEPALVGIHSELAPTKCHVSAYGRSFQVAWPPDENELILSLEALEVGTHEVKVGLADPTGQELSSGSLVVTIRDPQTRPEAATRGEGIRMLASPARPTVAELWEEDATVTIEGPIGGTADLHVALRSGDGTQLAEITRTVKLPVSDRDWGQVAYGIRTDTKFRRAYDDAESCVVSVTSGGVGFASLSCERGFVPLRWRFTKARDGSFVATLANRTGGPATVDFYPVDTPAEPVRYPSDAAISLPPRGGLLCATSDEVELAEIAPTNPNALLRAGVGRSNVPYGTNSLAEIRRLAAGHRKWALARSPQDAFAGRQRELAMDAFSRSIALVVCGTHWARTEQQLATADDPADYLEQMRRDVGVSEAHRALADAIAQNLWHWLSIGELAVGFSDVMARALQQNGVRSQSTAGRFLLTLAGRPGYILSDWSKVDCDYLLERVVASPVLLRAARFAVLGTRILNDQESALRSF